jgi:hypothetical protein
MPLNIMKKNKIKVHNNYQIQIISIVFIALFVVILDWNILANQLPQGEVSFWSTHYIGINLFCFICFLFSIGSYQNVQIDTDSGCIRYRNITTFYFWKEFKAIDIGWLWYEKAKAKAIISHIKFILKENKKSKQITFDIMDNRIISDGDSLLCKDITRLFLNMNKDVIISQELIDGLKTNKVGKTK